MVNHRVIRLIVAFGIGILLALYSYQRITDPEPAMQRAREEAAVFAAREIVRGYVSNGEQVAIVDPLAPDRVVGKVYVYPVDGGWQVSGHYRRSAERQWHPFLLAMNDNLQLTTLSVKDADPRLADLAASETRFSVDP